MRRRFDTEANYRAVFHDGIKHPKIKILNVAGNRGSKLTKEDRNKYARLLYETIKQFNESCIT